MACCYLRTGTEIARIELPLLAVVVVDRLGLICSILLRQCTLGDGYVWALRYRPPVR